ncbi:RnfABCDGE type electron transport complex subunit B [Arenicella xantha]|uniref:Electron transport complex protein RnfB n=1 Tax=Arenicella xantha TaxID=644221 RepID=A0A395JH81_9GAMM|nr:RnfABCDGE type electron transport complex subunit B [Arenicella xantha]RBP49195.1 electron transport complex protein RnfB [Arenicella xantha]
MQRDQKIKAIDEWLPQTQCTQCSYPRCHDYAVAIADGEADINQCPPGGDVTIRGLASLLGRIGKPLNPKFGIHKPKQLAVIDEAICIGCVMCIKACPTDAILGSAKVMHTVIERDCTGCELCIEPCPVDCIDMVDQPQQPDFTWRWDDYSPDATARARAQTNAKLARESARTQAKSSLAKLKELRKEKGSEQIKHDIAAALARVKQRSE